jgi:transposase InsO family protein
LYHLKVSNKNILGLPTLKEDLVSTLDILTNSKLIESNKSGDDCQLLIKKIHCYYGHPGRTALYRTIKGVIKIKNLKNKIDESVSTCELCQLNKRSSTKFGEVRGFAHSEEPFDLIASDIVGPFNTDEFVVRKDISKFWILTIIDVHSRFSKVFLISDISTKSVVKGISQWIETFKNPKRIITDQGRCYVSHEFKNYLKSKNITHTKI